MRVVRMNQKYFYFFSAAGRKAKIIASEAEFKTMREIETIMLEGTFKTFNLKFSNFLIYYAAHH